MKIPAAGFLMGILFLLLTLPLSGQIEERPQYAPRSEKHKNVRDELGRKQGLWKYYNRERVLTIEITYLNDIKHGPSIRHNSYNGVVTEESGYFNGKRDGEYKRYNYNGTLTTEGNYAMGRRIGNWVTYYVVNGEKRTEGAYNTNGKKDGNWKYYTSKGTMKSEGDYKNGVRDGTWVFYGPDGSRTEEKKFQNGKEIGVVSSSPVPKKNTKKQGNKPGQNPQPQQNQQAPGNQQNPQTPQAPNTNPPAPEQPSN